MVEIIVTNTNIQITQVAFRVTPPQGYRIRDMDTYLNEIIYLLSPMEIDVCPVDTYHVLMFRNVALDDLADIRRVCKNVLEKHLVETPALAGTIPITEFI